LQVEGANGDSSRATRVGDREEEQLLSSETVWKRHPEHRIQQRVQQSLQPQFIQILWYVARSLQFFFCLENNG